MGEKKGYFLAKVVKKFSFAYLVLPFPPVLSEKKFFCINFLTFEDTILSERDCFLNEIWIWLCVEPSKKERWLENLFCMIAAANDLSQVAWSDN